MSKRALHFDYKLSIFLPALRALIQAIIPDVSANSDGKLSGDAVARLTEKLSELMGPEAAQDFKQNRNERGEVCPLFEVSISPLLKLVLAG